MTRASAQAPSPTPCAMEGTALGARGRGAAKPRFAVGSCGQARRPDAVNLALADKVVWGVDGGLSGAGRRRASWINARGRWTG